MVTTATCWFDVMKCEIEPVCQDLHHHVIDTVLGVGLIPHDERAVARIHRHAQGTNAKISANDEIIPKSYKSVTGEVKIQLCLVVSFSLESSSLMLL